MNCEEFYDKVLKATLKQTEYIRKENQKIEDIENWSLLFRIYDKYEQMLYYPDFTTTNIHFETIDKKEITAGEILFDVCCWRKNARYEIDKCTGFRDESRQLIYSNDIIKYKDNEYLVLYLGYYGGFYLINTNTSDVISIADSSINMNESVITGNSHII